MAVIIIIISLCINLNILYIILVLNLLYPTAPVPAVSAVSHLVYSISENLRCIENWTLQEVKSKNISLLVNRCILLFFPNTNVTSLVKYNSLVKYCLISRRRWYCWPSSLLSYFKLSWYPVLSISNIWTKCLSRRWMHRPSTITYHLFSKGLYRSEISLYEVLADINRIIIVCLCTV